MFRQFLLCSSREVRCQVTNSNLLGYCLLFKETRVSIKSPGLELCHHPVSLSAGIRYCKYKCLINVRLLTSFVKSWNKVYIGLFVARISNSLKINNFLEYILFNFFFKFRQFSQCGKLAGDTSGRIFLSNADFFQHFCQVVSILAKT